MIAIFNVHLMVAGTSSCPSAGATSSGTSGCAAVNPIFLNLGGQPTAMMFSGTTAGLNGASDTLTATATFLLAGSSDAYGNTCSGGVGSLCVSLANTQVGGTQSRSDLLDSLYFSVAGNPALTAVSAKAGTVLNPSSTNKPVLSVAPQSPVLSGGWALVTTPGTDTLNSKLPTSGYAWTTVGNSGAFSNGTYNVGSDDYGLIAPGTSDTGGLKTIPIIQTVVFLTLSGFQTSNITEALSSISGAVFTWNSTGVFSANGIEVSDTPEPSTFASLGFALATSIALRWRKARRNP